MNRVLLVLVVGALAAVGYLMLPPESPSSDPLSAVDPPAVAICALEEGSGRTTTLGVVSNVNSDGLFTAFAGGRSAGSVSFDLGTSSSTQIDVVDVAAVGVAGGLVELPVVDSAVASVVSGAASLSAEGCASIPEQQVVVAGASTVSGTTFEIHLMNPYAGEAIVDITVQSESGLESAGELSAVIVPPRDSTVVDLAEILPGREQLNVIIDTAVGGVIAVARHGDRGDSAVWNAVAPAQDWLVPVPGLPGSRQVVVANAAAVEVEYQIDLHSSLGVEEAFQAGVIPPRGMIVVGVGALTEAPAALRVVTTGPVVSFVRQQTDTSISVSQGAVAAASTWLMPGAGSVSDEIGSVVVFNPGIEEAEFTLTARRRNSEAELRSVPAGAVVELETFERAADGYVIKSDRPVVVLWALSGGPGRALSLGTPVFDG